MLARLGSLVFVLHIVAACASTIGWTKHLNKSSLFKLSNRFKLEVMDAHKDSSQHVATLQPLSLSEANGPFRSANEKVSVQSGGLPTSNRLWSSTPEEFSK